MISCHASIVVYNTRNQLFVLKLSNILYVDETKNLVPPQGLWDELHKQDCWGLYLDIVGTRMPVRLGDNYPSRPVIPNIAGIRLSLRDDLGGQHADLHPQDQEIHWAENKASIEGIGPRKPSWYRGWRIASPWHACLVSEFRHLAQWLHYLYICFQFSE